MFLALLFTFLILAIFGKIFVFAVKASWGITKIVFGIVLFPLVLIAMVFAGLFVFVIPFVIIAGLISLFFLRA